MEYRASLYKVFLIASLNNRNHAGCMFLAQQLVHVFITWVSVLRLTSTMGIRLASHLFVLCLRLNHYTLPLEALSLDLALDYPKCVGSIFGLGSTDISFRLRGFMMGLGRCIAIHELLVLMTVSGCRFTPNKQAVLSLPLSKGINQRSRKSRSRR
jgi:hypothetical protein